MHPSDDWGRLGRGRAGHIFGVLLQGDTRGEISGSRVPYGDAQRGKTTQKFNSSPIQIQGGAGPRGDGAAALL